jgi:ABC-2 type transport system permease protein
MQTPIAQWQSINHHYSSARSAAGWVNLVYLPMGALSGLWFPLFMMPELLQKLAFVFPAYHLGQLSLAAVGQIDIDWGPHMGMLLIFTLVFGQLAAHGLRRSQT